MVPNTPSYDFVIENGGVLYRNERSSFFHTRRCKACKPASPSAVDYNRLREICLYVLVYDVILLAYLQFTRRHRKHYTLRFGLSTTNKIQYDVNTLRHGRSSCQRTTEKSGIFGIVAPSQSVWEAERAESRWKAAVTCACHGTRCNLSYKHSEETVNWHIAARSTRAPHIAFRLGRWSVAAGSGWITSRTRQRAVLKERERERNFQNYIWLSSGVCIVYSWERINE